MVILFKSLPIRRKVFLLVSFGRLKVYLLFLITTSPPRSLSRVREGSAQMLDKIISAEYVFGFLTHLFGGDVIGQGHGLHSDGFPIVAFP